MKSETVRTTAPATGQSMMTTLTTRIDSATRHLVFASLVNSADAKASPRAILRRYGDIGGNCPPVLGYESLKKAACGQHRASARHSMHLLGLGHRPQVHARAARRASRLRSRACQAACSRSRFSRSYRALMDDCLRQSRTTVYMTHKTAYTAKPIAIVPASETRVSTMFHTRNPATTTPRTV